MSEMSITVTFPTRTYVREADGYYARRDDGGLIDCHTDSDVVWALDKAAALQQDLAAARAEVEKSQALCNRWIEAALRSATTLHVAFDPTNPEGFMHAQTAHVLGIIERNKSLEADLAAVRGVEAWEGLRGTRIKWVEAPREPQSEWRAWSWGLRATANPRIVATGDSIIALGRALAAQEGA